MTARAIGTAVALLALLAGCGSQPPSPGVDTPAVEDLAGFGAAAPTAAPAPTAATARPTAAATPKPRTPSTRPTRSASPKPPPNAASRLRTLPGGARQVVVVSADGYGTSHATLETFYYDVYLDGRLGVDPIVKLLL